MSFLKSFTLINILFFGSTFQMFIDGSLPFQKHFKLNEVYEEFTSLIGMRSYIVVSNFDD